MVKLVIELRDGGFEVNEFNIENKIKNYLSHLYTVIERRSRVESNQKQVNIVLGNMLTYNAVIAGLEVEKNGFKKLISEIQTFTIVDKDIKDNLEHLENINLYISMIKNHGSCELLDFTI